MSHYATIDLQITGDADMLCKALMNVKNRYGGKWTKDQIEVHNKPVALYGFQGDQRNETAHVIIRRQHVGGAANDIGFYKTETGQWRAIISEYDSTFYNLSWQKQLGASWGIAKVCDTAEKQGKKWSIEEKREDGQTYAYVRITGY